MDLVSNLPDDILCHILSFLTTKEAALTSLLSKRWRNLFALVPNLDIVDLSCLLYPKEGNRDRDDIRQLFMEFVDRVLALQGNSPINKFTLSCADVDSDRFDCWLRNVMVRGVSELDLSICFHMQSSYKYQLSPECFENKKLVKLRICTSGIDFGLLDGSIFLPMLKTLVLQSVELSVDKLEILLHALPALEELSLVYIRWKYMFVDVCVSSARLKKLTIIRCGCLDSVSFDTPSLVYFCYSDHPVLEYYSVVKMESLVEAQINLIVTEEEIIRFREPNNDLLEDNEENVVLLFANNVWKLMNGIQNVQFLKLFADTLEVLSLRCESMPVFNNLKSLTIESNKRRAWQAMPVLLRNCPHLETLVLEGLFHHVTEKCGDACNCVSREVKGRSLKTCPVKLLKIREFQGTMEELGIVKHFLVYLPYLKEIKIYINGNGPTQLRVPKVSEAITQMFELDNKLSSCNVHLLVNGCLYKK